MMTAGLAEAQSSTGFFQTDMVPRAARQRFINFTATSPDPASAGHGGSGDGCRGW
jgi:hypothetical protein